MHRLCFSLLLSLACGWVTLQAQEVPLGTWSWSQDAMMTATARQELLEFCRAEGITHIDQHVSIRRTSDDSRGDGYTLQNAGKLTKLVTEASRQGVSVSALRGDKKMFFADQHEQRIASLQALIKFNDGLPDGVSLLGVKYDVEPYLTMEWKEGGESRDKVMREYLQCLIKIRRCLEQHGSELALSVDVPFWWDKDELSIQYDGQSKSFVKHIQDRVDSISLMSYRRSAKDVLRLVQQELSYAGSRERSVSVGLNFNVEVGEENVTTFAGHPVSMFRNTLAELRRTLHGSKAVRFIMLHDYKHLAKHLEQNGSTR